MGREYNIYRKTIEIREKENWVISSAEAYELALRAVVQSEPNLSLDLT